jgi:hypothetical protein
VVGAGTAGDAARALVRAALCSGVVGTSAMGTSFVRYAGAADVSVQLALVAPNWLTEVFADADDMARDVNSFTKEVVSSFWG